MTQLAAIIILATSLMTAFISGIFGMAGGLVLMGVLIALPSITVPMAMIIHGAIQMVANGWRGFLLREHIAWRVFGFYCIGAVIGIAGLLFVAWQPTKRQVYLVLGLAPLLIWLPKRWFHLDIQRPRDAIMAGVSVQALNTIAGVAGPMLDLFFVRTNMVRQEIVATKSVTQMVSHVIKIVFWSLPILQEGGLAAMPPLWFFLAAIPLAMSGTWAGKQVLQRMSDVSFVAWMKGLVTVIGCVYLARAAGWY